MNIQVSIHESSKDEDEKLELLIQGQVTLRQIGFAFQDGLRNHAKVVLVDARNSIRQLESGCFILTCFPFYSRRREEVNSAICYELKRELLNPIKTSC